MGLTDLVKLDRNIAAGLEPLRRGMKQHRLGEVLATGKAARKWVPDQVVSSLQRGKQGDLGTLLATGKPPHRRTFDQGAAPTIGTRLREFVLFGKLPFGADTAMRSRQEQAALQERIIRLERQIARELFIAPFAALLIGAGTLGFLPGTLVGIPLVVYATIPYWRLAYLQLFHQRQIGYRVMIALIMTGVLGSGRFLLHGFLLTISNLTDLFQISTYRASQNALTSLVGDMPQEVWIRHGSVETRVPIAELQAGDIVVAHAGEMIAVDGQVVDGSASIDQRALTGEAQPVEKEPGDHVFAGTLVITGTLDLRVEKAGDQTVVAQITDVLTNTIDYTSTLESKGRMIAERSVMPILLLSLASMPFLGVMPSLAILFSYFGAPMRGLAPLSVLTFLKLASQQSILVKDGRALETLREIDTVVFDKTGTLTLEQPHVAAIHPCNGISSEEVLRYAAAAEYKQTHPIARAIQAAAQEIALALPEAVSYEAGYGLKVQVNGKQVRIGSARFMQREAITIPPDIQSLQDGCHQQGHALVYVAVDDYLAGAMELHTTIRPEARQIIQGLHERGLQTVVISGDHTQPTRYLAEQLGIDTFFAEVLPEDKASLVEQLQAEGRMVCFIGDGINDAIALKQAHVSVSLRGATSIATDTAEIILMDESLCQVVRLFELADELHSTMQRNLVFSIIPGIIVLGGVYGFRLSLLGAGLVNLGGFWVGMGNAVSPGVRYYLTGTDHS